jgi:Flp pilus assembly protein CpaB
MLATEMGDIGLALRSIGDGQQGIDDKTTTDVKMSNVLSKLSTMQQTSSGVRVYNGADMQEVEARNPAPTSGVSFDVEQAPQPNNTIYLDPALVGGPNNE